MKRSAGESEALRAIFFSSRTLPFTARAAQAGKAGDSSGNQSARAAAGTRW